MQHVQMSFEQYANNLRRIYWLEFIDQQVRAQNQTEFRASLVEANFEIVNSASARR